MMINEITPLVITYNEAPNISRTLSKLLWAKRVLVIDSGSTDETLEILRAYPQVDVIRKEFNDFASQCNFGLGQIKTTWVLSLDADYELSDDLVDELGGLVPSVGVSGYRARFIYRIFGRTLRGSLYPPRTVLYRKDSGRYYNLGHGHRVDIHGDVVDLRGVIFHDDRKPLTRWLASQQRYAQEEAEYLLGMPAEELSKTDRLRLMAWPAPALVCLYTLVAKGCLLDGLPGWYYVLQRLCAEVMLALEIVGRRLAVDDRRNSSESQGF
jgi:glycosyltransferase involved in cell wall biosynthesis